MFSKTPTNKSTNNYLDNINLLKEKINTAQAIVIGAGSGLSAAAGLTYSGERFTKNFAPFIKKYDLQNMYSAGFYPYPTLEEKWGYWCHHIYHNRYHPIETQVYSQLLSLVQNKNYFVLTTNVDHCFIRSGFDKKKIFYTQGNYGLWQCSVPCHQKTYNNKKIVDKMLDAERDTKIPSHLVPKCPQCNAPMSMNLRADDTFVQDNGWYAACDRYETFIKQNLNSTILFLELGVGGNTPGIIKYPFWQMTYNNKKATFISINAGETICAKEIVAQSILLEDDICAVLKMI